jgi:hypothetical protein
MEIKLLFGFDEIMFLSHIKKMNYQRLCKISGTYLRRFEIVTQY